MDPRLEIAAVAFGAVAGPRARPRRELRRSPRCCAPRPRRPARRRGRGWRRASAHDPADFAGIDDAVALVLRHVAPGSRITVHGDYDVDGVCSTAILVRGAALARRATCDWYLPSRTEDGYGLSAATVERLAARGTRLLHHRRLRDHRGRGGRRGARAPASTSWSPTTTRRGPTACCPTRRSSIPASAATRARTCARRASPTSSPRALLRGAGRDPARRRRRPRPRGAGDGRRLRAAARREPARSCAPGCARWRATEQAGPARADAVAQVDPGARRRRAVGFRLAPRINAAGRLDRADAGLELLLTDDAERAGQIAEELDAANAERRHVETRILFEAEAQVAAQPGERPRTSWRPTAGIRA